MRIYSANDEETLRTRRLLKEWVDDGALAKGQYERLQQETICDLRTTNIFLRLVLFVFTLLAVGAVVGLFMIGLRSGQAVGGLFVFFAVACYVAAEVATSQAHLYHHGIEEALAVISVGFLCAGVGILLFSDHVYPPQIHATQALVPATGMVGSLWIWYRFNLWYGFLAAMVAVYWLPVFWTTSHPLQLGIIVAFYVAGLLCVIATARHHRGDFLESVYSVAEAMLWLGIYLTLNLKVSPLGLVHDFWATGPRPDAELARPFYWATWVLIWCLPPIVLMRGIRQKDRLVLAVGMIVTVLTLVSNKPYLGWQRHTWDPMLLGVVLCGVVWFLRRWLSRGTDGVRGGFMAARPSGKDERWLQAGSGALGLVAPHLVTPAPQPHHAEFEFDGGSSDGGGASGDF